MMRHDHPETVADLRAERDRAREECGHEKAMRASLRDELYGFIRHYQEQKERAEAAEAEVERLRAEIRDRESERADLRDRVQKAIAAWDDAVTSDPCSDCSVDGVALWSYASDKAVDDAIDALRPAIEWPS